MALENTTIANLVPSEKLLNGLVEMRVAESNEFRNAGLMVSSPLVNEVASGGPRKVSIPFLNPLATDEVNIGTDDLTQIANSGKLTADEFAALRHDLNYGWGASDLARMVTGYDAMSGITAGIAGYWTAIEKQIAVSTLTGLMDVDTDLVFDAAKAETFSVDHVIDAALAKGENDKMLTTLVVHPRVRAQLQKAEGNQFIPASKTDIGFDTYAGYKLIYSNAMTVFQEGEEGEEVTYANSALVGDGFFAYGLGSQPNPMEVERVPGGGRGAGGERLWSRRSIVCHPQGFDYVGNVAPAISALATASNWNLAIDADEVAVQFIVSKL